MAATMSSPILQLIRRIVEDHHMRELSDQDLLRRFSAQREEIVFHTLLRRHGPMVLDVCRGVLGDGPDAEDAFQATFLLLAEKAGSIRKMASVGSWLYGVAYRTALKARAQVAMRRKHEACAQEREPSGCDEVSWREVRGMLHEELSRLPQRYREPLVLCYLEGATQKSAAAQMGLAERTLRARLERGRELLKARLMRRGLAPAALLVVAAWPTAKTLASVPAGLIGSTVMAAARVAAGGAATSVVSAKFAALTEGVVRAMLLTKPKITTAILWIVGILGATVGMSALWAPTWEQPKAQKAEGEVPAWKERATMPYEGAFFVFSIALSPDGKTLATGINHFDVTKSGQVVLWDTTTGKQRTVLEGHTALVHSVAFSPDGKSLASASHDKTVKLWDVAEGKELRSFEVTKAGVTICVTFSPDGKALAVGWARGGVGDEKEGVKLLDIASGKEIAGFPGFKAAFSPDGKILATGTLDGVLKLWDVASGKERTSLEAHTGPITFIAFSPDGTTLATLGNGDDSVKLWDIATTKERSSLKQPTQVVESLAFSPDGKSLAAGSYEKDGTHVAGKVILWDVPTGKKQDSLPVENGPVTAVAFAPRAGTLAAGSFSALPDGTITNFARGVTKVELKVWERK